MSVLGAMGSLRTLPLVADEGDVSKQIASIQPGIRSLQLVTQTRTKGLSFPAPHCPSVGLGGFLMGGGIGWNYGHRDAVACFSIDAAEVVTADGNRVIASADQNPDLLWTCAAWAEGFLAL